MSENKLLEKNVIILKMRAILFDVILNYLYLHRECNPGRVPEKYPKS